MKKENLKLLSGLDSKNDGKIYHLLSEPEKTELDIAFEESLDPTNLISHEEVKRSHQKWMR